MGQDGFVVYAVKFPAGVDPDTYINENGVEEFNKYIEKHREDFVQFHYSIAKGRGATGVSRWGG